MEAFKESISEETTRYSTAEDGLDLEGVSRATNGHDLLRGAARDIFDTWG